MTGLITYGEGGYKPAQQDSNIVSTSDSPQPVDAANADALRAKAASALQANAAFLALAAPTNAQTVQQVQTLTRECNALIRLLIGALDTTAGT